MPDEADECDDAVAGVLADVADEYLARLARGEDPDPEEYAARYPAAAGAVRGVLASLRLTAPPPRPCRVDPLPLPSAPQTLGEFGDWAAAGWGWCTRPSNSPSAGGWR